MNRSGIDYIEKLEALQETMPSFEELVMSMHGTFVQYEMEQGFAVGHGLLHEADCAVQKYFATGDSVFPEHKHKEFEYFIVIEGKGVVTIEGEKQPFAPRDFIVIRPGQTHTWYYETPCKMIAITVPASQGFPHGEG